MVHKIKILPTWEIMRTFRFLLGFVLLVVAIIYLTGEAEDKAENSSSAKLSREYKPPEQAMKPQCDWFSGRWVYDNERYPLYKESECSFMSELSACEMNGRKDLSYQYWRWQPHHCNLPRFNATELMERLRNKRLVFVGDSVNRGQWESLLCIVESIIPRSLWSRHSNGSLMSAKAIEYNAYIEFYWAPLLVESNFDNPGRHQARNMIVRFNAIDKHARYWTDADILIFNSYAWWRKPKIKVLWGEFDRPNKIYKKIEMIRAYEMALRTWSDWLDIHINRTKTQIFWVSMSPIHDRREEWGGPSGMKCYNETQPIWEVNYRGSGSDFTMMQVVEAAIDNLKKNRDLSVRLLNITQMSNYRKDGHFAIHRKLPMPLTKDQLAHPSCYADCVHWCLPGVPDTWNELLFAHLLHL